MPADIKSQRFFFKCQALSFRPLFDVGQHRRIDDLRIYRTVKQTDLGIQPFLLYALPVIQCVFQSRHHLRSPGAGAVKGAAFYQGFDDALVYFLQIDPLTKTK